MIFPNIFKNSFDISRNKKISIFVIIAVSSLLIRLSYVSFDVPLFFDNLTYFNYAIEISKLGQLPQTYYLANNGWSIFLSFFFTIFQHNETNDLMQLQKILSIVLSTSTIIPLYYLLKKFFNFSLIFLGVIIFAFEPRLIQNSILGIADPLYILLITTSFVFFLNYSIKNTYISFALVSLATLVRSEGIFVFAAFVILLFFKEKKKIKLPKYIPAIAIFFLILLPMIAHQHQIEEKDTIFGRVVGVTEIIIQDPKQTDGQSGSVFILRGLENFPKYFVWDLIPIFIVFFPVGIFYLFKEMNFEKKFVIITGISMMIPAFYAYSIPLLDTRYLYFIYPLLTIVSLLGIQRLIKNSNKKIPIIILISIGVILASLVYLSIKIIHGFY